MTDLDESNITDQNRGIEPEKQKTQGTIMIETAHDILNLKPFYLLVTHGVCTSSKQEN